MSGRVPSGAGRDVPREPGGECSRCGRFDQHARWCQYREGTPQRRHLPWSKPKDGGYRARPSDEPKPPPPVGRGAASSTEPPWCWAVLDGTTTCLMARGHSGNHAGAPLDGGWVRWDA